MLHFSYENKAFIVRRNASGLGVRAVLSQKSNYNDEKESRDVLESSRNLLMRPLEKECAALLWIQFRIQLLVNLFTKRLLYLISSHIEHTKGI